MRPSFGWCSVAAVLALLTGCDQKTTQKEPPALGWPQIVIVDIDNPHGSTWTYIDENGRYTRTVSTWVSYDVAPTVKACRGTVSPQSVAPWFEKVRQVALTSDTRLANEIRSGMQPRKGLDPMPPALRFYMSDDVGLQPARPESLDQMDALATEFARATLQGENEKCETTPGG